MEAWPGTLTGFTRFLEERRGVGHFGIGVGGWGDPSLLPAHVMHNLSLPPSQRALKYCRADVFTTFFHNSEIFWGGIAYN